MQNYYNRLKEQNSNFLKKHSDDPIYWWAFGPEALLAAKEANRPILLSIGFSSCHWCNVMAADSFKNQEIADIINKNFIPILVDREEDPDIDNYYQQAAHLFSKQSGWPLNAFLTADGKPFFAGTFFPATKGPEGALTFQDLLNQLSERYENNHDEIEKTAIQADQAIKEGFINTQKVEYQGHFPAPMAVLNAIKEHKNETDGGYGGAPRFPNFPFYEWAVEQIIEGMIEKDEAKFIVDSLEKMLMGGIIDQVRGGIHRYSTDASWKRPHFEKILHNQASLIRLLSKLGLIYPSPLVFDTLINSLDFLATEMHAEDGHFFGSQDADSEGGEGLYYCFTEAEFEDALNKYEDGDEELTQNCEKLKNWMGITKEGNCWGGLNTICLNGDHKQEFLTQEGWDLIRKAKKALWKERKDRMPPITDNKGVASWNFSMVSALCDVIQYSNIDVIKNMASSLLLKTLPAMISQFCSAKGPGKLDINHTTTSDNRLHYFEDYVFFAEAQLRSYEVTGNPAFKSNFKELLPIIAQKFIEGENAFIRSLEHNDQRHFANQKILSFDGSSRSAVSTYMILIRRAALLFKEPEMLDTIEQIKNNYLHMILRNPINSGEGLRALSYPNEVYRVIRVPKHWLSNSKFTSFTAYFMSRFVIEYREEEAEQWQICNLNSCELQGSGLDNFIETLSPKGKSDG